MQVVTTDKDTRAINRHTLQSDDTFESECIPCLHSRHLCMGEPGYMPFSYKGVLYFAGMSSDLYTCCIYRVDKHDGVYAVHKICRVDLYAAGKPKVDTNSTLVGTEEKPFPVAICYWPDAVHFRESEVYISRFYGIVVIDLKAMTLSRVMDNPLGHIGFALAGSVSYFMTKTNDDTVCSPINDSIIRLPDAAYWSDKKGAKMHTIDDTLYVECATGQIYRVDANEESFSVKIVPVSELPIKRSAKIVGEYNSPHSLVIPGTSCTKSLVLPSPETHCTACIVTQL